MKKLLEAFDTGLGFESSLPFILSTLNNLYKIYIRPHLDFGDDVYRGLAMKCEYADSFKLNHLMEKLESVQYTAALAIIGAWKGTSLEKLYNELGWDSLFLRLWSRHLALIFKFVNN